MPPLSTILNRTIFQPDVNLSAYVLMFPTSKNFPFAVAPTRHGELVQLTGTTPFRKIPHVGIAPPRPAVAFRRSNRSLRK